MAVILHRRLPRAVFQLAALSPSKWAWSPPPVERNCQFKPANVRGYSENTIQKNQGPSVALATTTYDPQRPINSRLIEDDVDSSDDDNDCLVYVSKSPTKSYATKSPVLQNVKKKGSNFKLDRAKRKPKTLKNPLYEAIEAYSTKNDPRSFQKHRPEYKLICYNSERSIETSIEEGKSILEKVTISLAPSDVVIFFEKLSCLPEEEMAAVKLNKQFRMLCSCSISNLRLYTNSEIISVFNAFVRLGIDSTHPMLKKYEQEFCLRVEQLSTNELLLVADLFRYLPFSCPRFLDMVYSCMELRYLDLTLPQVIQLTYIIGEGRRAPKQLLNKIETLVSKYLTSLNVEEIGAVCLGFFKTKNVLPNLIVHQFGDILAENIDQMTNYTLVSTLKMFRITHTDHISFLKRVSQDAHKRIPKMKIQGIMHVVLSFSTLHIFDEDLMHAVALALPDRLSYCRSKDLAKFLWSFGVLRYEPPNADVVFNAFIKQIRNMLESFTKFPEHFLSCLMGLVLCQRFPFDLINIALSKMFIMQSAKIKEFELRKDIFTIAGTVEIECPQYSGNTISPEFRKEVTDMLVELSTLSIYTRAEVEEAYLLMQHILGGAQYVKEHMILPHMRSKDLEVHLDVDRKPIAINSNNQPLSTNVKITDNLLNKLTNMSTVSASSSDNIDLKYPSVTGNLTTNRPVMKNETPTGQPEIVKLAIQVTNRNQYRYDSKELLGFHAMKRRQLHKLGYVVVEVPFWEWFPLYRGSQSKKLDYLHQKVFSAV